VFAPSFLWMMIGGRRAGQITRPVAAIAKSGIELVQGAIEHIDPAQRAVRVNGGTLSADYLVMALGADLDPETIPGLAQAGHNFYTLGGAESLREARLDVRSGRIAVLVSAMPFKCPGAPNEAAMLLEHDCRRRGIREQVRIDLYTAEPGPMPVAGPAVSDALRRMIEAKGIGYHPNHAVTTVDPLRREMTFANGASATFDLLAYVPHHRAPQVVREAGMCGESGWVAAGRLSGAATSMRIRRRRYGSGHPACSCTWARWRMRSSGCIGGRSACAATHMWHDACKCRQCSRSCSSTTRPIAPPR
jgi:sulfide:quinone oxidoreductase